MPRAELETRLRGLLEQGDWREVVVDNRRTAHRGVSEIEDRPRVRVLEDADTSPVSGAYVKCYPCEHTWVRTPSAPELAEDALEDAAPFTGDSETS